MSLELWENDGMSYRKKYRGRDASGNRIVQRIGQIYVYIYKYILWELQQRCVIVVAVVVVVSFFTKKTFPST